MKKKESNINYFTYVLDLVSNFVVNVIKKVNKLLTSKRKGGFVKAVIRIICCLFLLSILKIPVELIGKAIYGILYLCNIPFDTLILNSWTLTYETIYMIISLIILMKTAFNISNNKEFAFEYKGSLENSKKVYETGYNVLRIFTIISFIPLVLFGVLLFALLGIFVGFISHGMYLFGPILMVAGLLIVLCFLLSYLYDVVFDNKGGNK